MGNDTISESYVRSNNYGIQFGIVMPLDKSITRMCKELVTRTLERERLSFELTRLKECSKLLELGYTIRPDLTSMYFAATLSPFLPGVALSRPLP